MDHVISDRNSINEGRKVVIVPPPKKIQKISLQQKGRSASSKPSLVKSTRNIKPSPKIESNSKGNRGRMKTVIAIDDDDDEEEEEEESDDAGKGDFMYGVREDFNEMSEDEDEISSIFTDDGDRLLANLEKALNDTDYMSPAKVNGIRKKGKCSLCGSYEHNKKFHNTEKVPAENESEGDKKRKKKVNTAKSTKQEVVTKKRKVQFKEEEEEEEEEEKVKPKTKMPVKSSPKDEESDIDNNYNNKKKGKGAVMADSEEEEEEEGDMFQYKVPMTNTSKKKEVVRKEKKVQFTKDNYKLDEADILLSNLEESLLIKKNNNNYNNNNNKIKSVLEEDEEEIKRAMMEEDEDEEEEKDDEEDDDDDEADDLLTKLEKSVF